MPSRNLVSIIISDMETHPSLPRLLQSVASQSIGLERTEILIAHNTTHSSEDASVWSAIAGTDNIRQIPLDKNILPSQARNAAAASSNGEFLIFLRPDYRLDPKYMTTALSVFDDKPETDIIYTDYIRLNAKKSTVRPGMVQLPDFDDALLQTQNILGPAVMLRREAWDSTQGFRDNTVYRDWDLWIQTALAGNQFLRVNYPLASCEHGKISFRERAEDGRYKAMIVINNQAYFHMHTVRWALSYLRGDAWAQAFGFMNIPGPMDVTKMMHDFNSKQMGGEHLTQEAIRQFETSPTASEAIR
ncbi:glycosyltransferase [uncultured Pseudodesulfovibrio sp.]|uniref:glycosyltransferase n=1 Tax=uncultured Pseudodesulfovibrio sp. TaxID=2035858 RepID=UPI0029C97F5F|nr:glycosyltransferase [uncultured Pseudodesulfovibrio sp.]